MRRNCPVKKRDIGLSLPPIVPVALWSNFHAPAAKLQHPSHVQPLRFCQILFCNVVYRSAGPTWKISRRSHAKTGDTIRWTLPVMLLSWNWEDIAMKVSVLLSTGIVVAILSVAPTNARVAQSIRKPQTAPVWNPGEPWPPRWANFEACAAAGKKWAWDQNSTSLWCGVQPYGAAGDNRLSRNLR